MNSTSSILLVPFLLLGPIGCEHSAPDIDDDLEYVAPAFRSGTLAMQGYPSEGQICFELSYPCSAPEAAGIEQDNVHTWSWAAQTQHADAPIDDAPRWACFSTEDVTEGLHLYKFRATCSGVTDTTISQRYITSHSPLAFGSIFANQTYYQGGATIRLVLEADGGYAAQADFSAIDSGYVTGSETVSPTPTGYEIEYILSSTNSIVSGDYRIPVKVYDPASSSSASQTHEIELRYLPNGRMHAHVARGYYRPDARPSLTADGSLLLDAVTDTNVDVSATPLDDEPDFSSVGPSNDATSGRVFDIDFRT